MFRLAIMIICCCIVKTTLAARLTRDSKTSKDMDTIIETLTDNLDFKDDPAKALRFLYIKEQFKGVIEEIIENALTYVKTIFKEIRVKVLKKLGKWTLSDIFHSIFDGVTDFVNDSTIIPQLFDDDKDISSEHVTEPHSDSEHHTFPNYPVYNYHNRPYPYSNNYFNRF